MRSCFWWVKNTMNEVKCWAVRTNTTSWLTYIYILFLTPQNFAFQIRTIFICLQLLSISTNKHPLITLSTMVHVNGSKLVTGYVKLTLQKHLSFYAISIVVIIPVHKVIHWLHLLVLSQSSPPIVRIKGCFVGWMRRILVDWSLSSRWSLIV